MNDEDSKAPAESDAAEPENSQPDPSAVARGRVESRRWWIKLIAQPLLLLAAGAALIVSLGVLQKFGWFTVGGGAGGDPAASSSSDTRMYICPMLCTPPQIGPGRCPVCEMELVPATSGGGPTDPLSVQIDPAARRVANIRTVAVKSAALTRTIRAVGELNYDEGSLRTISAYVDGRLDRLYADYTGVVVEKGDNLALVYSPRLYSGQVELLLAKKARDESQSSSLQRVVQSNQDMYESTKQRLIELGMTRQQIEQLERAGEANSRMHCGADQRHRNQEVRHRRPVRSGRPGNLRSGGPVHRLAHVGIVSRRRRGHPLRTESGSGSTVATGPKVYWSRRLR